MTKSISNAIKSPVERLYDCIQRVTANSPAYVIDPVSDFTRKRKLTMDKLMYFLLQSGAESVNSSLCLGYSFVDEMPTASAICQARDKLDPDAFLRILHLFNVSHPLLKTFHGWTLMAFDGSAVNIPFDKEDSYTLMQKGELCFSQYHMNALYDVLNEIFYDVVLDSPRKTREVKALMEILDHRNYPEKSIFIEDRGICSYELLAKCQEEGHKIIVRTKDVNSGSGMLKNLPLPNTDEFDVDIPVILTRKQDKEVKGNPHLFKYLPWTSSFSLMPPGGDQYYCLKLRVIRRKVEDGKYITIITNLDRTEFSADLLKELYHLRWREEVAFLKLKYPVAMLHFNSRKRRHIQQEIYASIILYNLCSISIGETSVKDNREHVGKKYLFQTEFSVTVTNCRMLLRKQITWEEFVRRIKKFLVPIRPGRKALRNVKPQSVRSMVHRAA